MLNKLNLEVYNITVGLHHMRYKSNDPPNYRKCVNYKQSKLRLLKGSDMALDNMHIEHHFSLGDKHLAIPIAKFITIS